MDHRSPTYSCVASRRRSGLFSRFDEGVRFSRRTISVARFRRHDYWLFLGAELGKLSYRVGVGSYAKAKVDLDFLLNSTLLSKGSMMQTGKACGVPSDWSVF